MIEKYLNYDIELIINQLLFDDKKITNNIYSKVNDKLYCLKKGK